MTRAEGEKGPWQDNAGWPFVRASTGGAKTWIHEEELADVYDALDCDTPFSDAFQPETRAKEKVEILAEVLLTFLASLTDGVITRSLWEKLEECLVMREKTKQFSTPDDDKMAILEIMASAPSHNASFLLILSFLQNIANQITEQSKPKPDDSSRNSVDLPASPQAKVRRRTLSKVPEVAIRQLIVKNYAVVFAGVLFKPKEDGRMRERDRAMRKERMVGIIELFMNDAA